MDAGGSSSIEKNMESVEVHSDTVEIIPGFPTFEAFTQAAFKSLMEATRNSNNLPTNENWDYYSSFPSFPRIMNAEGARVLELIKTILQHQGMKGNIVRREFEEKFDLIVDANDSILERVLYHRPQIKFKDKADNSVALFKSQIKDKPKSRKPLSI